MGVVALLAFFLVFYPQTDTISSKDEVDPDVLDCMTSLGCFKNKDKLIRNLLKNE